MISIICPVYNEKDTIELFLTEVCKVLDKTQFKYELLFVNDGSGDETLQQLKKLKTVYPQIKIINLSRNFGKEAALTAGLDNALGDAIIPIDVDLQDPPHLILTLIEKWQLGYDVVIAKRINRNSDSFWKKFTATAFYKIHNALTKDKIPENVGDFRLISKKVNEALKLLPEKERFMKGLFHWVGFNSTIIEYTRNVRIIGKTKFNNKKLWKLAIDGITSFSTVPLKFWTYLGGWITLISFFYGAFIIYKTLIGDITTPGYSSLFTAVVFFGGIQLIGIGVLGEYIGRIYIEAKQRPIYIIEEII